MGNKDKDAFGYIWRVVVTVFAVGVIITSFVLGSYPVGIGTIAGAAWFLKYVWEDYAE